MFDLSFGDVRVPASRFGSPTLPLSRYTGMFERGRANGDGELIRNLDDLEEQRKKTPGCLGYTGYIGDGILPSDMGTKI